MELLKINEVDQKLSSQRRKYNSNSYTIPMKVYWLQLIYNLWKKCEFSQLFYFDSKVEIKFLIVFLS